MNRRLRALAERAYISMATRVAKQYMDVPFRFVFSTGRTGTALLSKAIGFSYVYCSHEPQSDCFELATMRWRKGLDPQDVLAKYLFMRRKTLAGVRRSNATYIETNNNLSLIADCLSRLPNYDAVHIVRDPRSWIISAMNKTSGGSEDHTSFFLSTLDRRRRLTPCDLSGNLQETLLERTITPVEWVVMSRLEQLCWYYVLVNRLIEHQTQPRINRIRLEDVLGQDKAAIQNLASALAVPADGLSRRLQTLAATRVNTTPRLIADDLGTLADQERELVQERLGGIADDYGYG